MLEPIPHQSLADGVFAQLRDRIVRGEMEPGEPLPSERALCEVLGVNRGVVREALRRLEQARLVSVRHGGTSRVLDYWDAAGLDLLPELLVDTAGRIDTAVVRGILEMRSAIAPDVARLAAERAGASDAERLQEIVRSMREAGGSGEDDAPAALQELAHAFWSALVRACGNVAYRLAFNSLHETYAKSWELLRTVLADEFSATERFARLADAVAAGDALAAEAGAREIVAVGAARIAAALDALEQHEPSRGVAR